MSKKLIRTDSLYLACACDMRGELVKVKRNEQGRAYWYFEDTEPVQTVLSDFFRGGVMGDLCLYSRTVIKYKRSLVNPDRPARVPGSRE